jgi:flagellar protein FlaF
MGFSVSISVGILFIVVIAVVSVVVTNLNIAEGYMEEAKKSYNELQENKLNTKVTILSISVSGTSASYSINITVKNDGSTELDPLKISVLVDGDPKTFSVTPSTLWIPENEITISVENLSGSGMHRVKVVAENGIADYSTYSI